MLDLPFVYEQELKEKTERMESVESALFVENEGANENTEKQRMKLAL